MIPLSCKNTAIKHVLSYQERVIKWTLSAKMEAAVTESSAAPGTDSAQLIKNIMHTGFFLFYFCNNSTACHWLLLTESKAIESYRNQLNHSVIILFKF